MKVPLRLAGRLMAVPADWEPVLRGVCSYDHAMTEQVNGRTEYFSERKQLYSVVGNEFVTFRGLRFRIEQLVNEKGHDLEVVEDCEPYRDPSVFMPDADAVDGVSWRYRQFDSFLLPSLHDDGIIDAVTAYGKTFITGKICQGYPRARILVIVPGVALSGEMHKELTNLLGKGKVGHYATGSRNRHTRRVTVATPESMSHVNERHPDIILYDEVHTAASEGRGDRLLAFNHAKMFGFTGTADGRSDNAELRIEAIFGPKRINVPYQTARQHGLVAEVHYKQVPVYSGKKARDCYRDTDKMRYPIWQNKERNHVLALEAARFAADNPGEQVLVATCRTEHALYLQQAFQELGWNIPVICGAISADREESLREHKALTDDSWVITDRVGVRNYRDAFIHKRELYAIATSTFSTGADFRHLRCLIYASGDTAKIAQKQWTGRAMRLGGQCADEARSLVIDTSDEFCDSAKRRSQARRLVAEQSGWSLESSRG